MKQAIPITLALVLLGAAFAGAGGAQERHISLAEALHTALEQNPSVGAVRSQRRAAEARRKESTGGFWPQFLVTAGYFVYQEPSIVLPIHEQGVFPPLDTQIFDMRLQLHLPIFNGGRTLANRRAAKAGIRESLVQEEEVRITLIERVTQIFVQAQEIEDKGDLVTSRVRSLQRRHDELTRLLGEGRVSPADLANVAAFLDGARADSIEIAMKKTELALRLGQLISLPGPVYPRLDDAQGLVKTGMKPDTVLFGQPGPQVRKAEAKVEQAQAMKSVVKSSFWPEISGFAIDVYRSGANLKMVGEWTVGLNLKVPIFQGGIRLAKMRQAQAAVNAAENNLRYAQTAQQTELQIARRQWQAAKQRRQRITMAVENKANSVAAWQKMYEAGRIPLSELLVRETELLQLQMQERSLVYFEVLSILRYQAIAGALNEQTAITLTGRTE